MAAKEKEGSAVYAHVRRKVASSISSQVHKVLLQELEEKTGKNAERRYLERKDAMAAYTAQNNSDAGRRIAAKTPFAELLRRSTEPDTYRRLRRHKPRAYADDDGAALKAEWGRYKREVGERVPPSYLPQVAGAGSLELFSTTAWTESKLRKREYPLLQSLSADAPLVLVRPEQAAEAVGASGKTIPRESLSAVTGSVERFVGEIVERIASGRDPAAALSSQDAAALISRADSLINARPTEEDERYLKSAEFRSKLKRELDWFVGRQLMPYFVEKSIGAVAESVRKMRATFNEQLQNERAQFMQPDEVDTARDALLEQLIEYDFFVDEAQSQFGRGGDGLEDLLPPFLATVHASMAVDYVQSVADDLQRASCVRTDRVTRELDGIRLRRRDQLYRAYATVANAPDANKSNE